MITVHSDIWKTKTYNNGEESPEYQLIIAAHKDNFEHVKKIVISNERVLDVNAAVEHSPTKGNGTALILTGSKEIASFLLQNAADINRVYNANNMNITALDSALKESEKVPVKNSAQKTQNAEEYVNFLKENGAKTFKELSYAN